MKRMMLLSLLVFSFMGCAKEGGSGSNTASKPSFQSEGEKITKTACKVCHAQGINGAPIIGNKKMWDDRVPRGIEQLSLNASQGYGLMPAKGGRTDLSDEQIRMAVEYMLEQLQ